VSRRPVLILGGSSDIGCAIAHRFAAAGHPLQLAGRRPDELAADRSDIALRHGVEVTTHAFDALALDRIESLFDLVAGKPLGCVPAAPKPCDKDS
jgi:decaprenylphospho-beta-D-erythro-pentofuranosid-2-ulose 2-reductase